MIFHKIWQKKDTGKYPEGSIMNLAKQAGIPNGTKFKSLDDYLGMLEGKALKSQLRMKQANQMVRLTKT